MKLEIQYQQKYSRGELLLRSFLGLFYIAIPHAFCLFFLGIASAILIFITWWAILFTGKFPKGIFDYQLNLYRWQLRLNARMMNLSDGYPAFGLNAADDKTVLELPYIGNYSRGKLLLITFFGWLMIIPHAFLLIFVAIGVWVVMIISWFAVLFTGKYPANLHDYMVRYIRWTYRVNFYLMWMINDYPPFNGGRDEAATIADQFSPGAAMA